MRDEFLITLPTLHVPFVTVDHMLSLLLYTIRLLLMLMVVTNGKASVDPRTIISPRRRTVVAKRKKIIILLVQFVFVFLFLLANIRL